MTEPDSLTLIFLRRIDEKLDRMAVDPAGIGTRVTAPEQAVARLHSGVAALHGDFAGQSALATAE
jgi:hypothetical protein